MSELQNDVIDGCRLQSLHNSSTVTSWHTSSPLKVNIT